MKNNRKISSKTFGIHTYEHNNLSLKKKREKIDSEISLLHGIPPRALFYIIATGCITLFLECITPYFVHHYSSKTPLPSQNQWRSECALYASHFKSCVKKSLQDSTITPKELKEIASESKFFLNYHYKHKQSHTPHSYPHITTAEYIYMIKKLQSQNTHYSNMAAYHITSTYLFQNINLLEKHITTVESHTDYNVNKDNLYMLYDKFMTYKKYHPHSVLDALMNNKVEKVIPHHY